MKKFFIAIAMMLTIGTCADAASQNHRHTPRAEQADTVKQDNQDAVEAFSDTTSVAPDDEEESAVIRYNGQMVTGKQLAHEILDDLDGNDIAGMVFVLGICLILFVLAPIAVIVAIFYFINRNRRERYRLAQMAMQNGQPIPDELLKENRPGLEVKDDYASGMRQLFLGLGLMVFLGYTAGKIGFAVGALVFFIGLGKVVIAKTSKRIGN